MNSWYKPLTAFWTKINNDWIFNLAGLLAFNFLLASFPLLLVLLAIAGFTLGAIDPQTEHALIQNLATAIPSQAGTTLVAAAVTNLRHSAGVLLVLGILTSIFLGSRLFIVIENCFGIIFRLRARDVLRQNLIAVGLLVVYILLIPLFFFASLLPSRLITAITPTGFGGFFVQVLLLIGMLIMAMILFGLVYVIVPNRRLSFHHLWRGTVVASVLLVLYEKLFPFYTQVFLRPTNYGSIAGFAIVILIFYNYLAFILLLGAEINSWAAGDRGTMGDLQAIVNELDTHRTRISTTIPAAATPDEVLEPHATMTPKNQQANVTSRANLPKSLSTPAQVLREQQHGRSIVAGQIAALGFLTVALFTGWMRRRR